MAHLASRALHWAVNLAGKSSLHSADSLTKHHSTACSDFSHDRLSSTVGRDRWRDRCTSFTMQCIRCQRCPTILTLTHEQGGPLFAFTGANSGLTCVYIGQLQDSMQTVSSTGLFGQSLHVEAFTHCHCVFCLDLQFCSEG